MVRWMNIAIVVVALPVGSVWPQNGRDRALSPKTVQVDLAGDVNGDGHVDRQSAARDVKWEDEAPGLIVGVNDNNSDEDGYCDMDNARIDGESDWEDMRVVYVVLRTRGAKGRAVLSCPRKAARKYLRVFDDAPVAKARVVIGPEAGNRHVIEVDGTSTTRRFHIEALAGGRAFRLDLRFFDLRGNLVACDGIWVSTLGASIVGGFYIGD